MKSLLKVITAAFFIAIATPHIAAETHYKPHISIGGHAGLAMGRMSFSPAVQQKWLNGSVGGVTFRYSEEKVFGLVAELNYEQRGWAENFEDTPLTYSRTLSYLQLPVMTHINFGSRRFKGFANLGPVVGVLLGESISANFDYHNPTAAPGFPERKRMTEQLYTPVKNKFDYGITVGLGAEYYLQPRHSITAEVRFYYGLGNIFPSSKADTFSASRSMSLAFMLGYNFRIR